LDKEIDLQEILSRIQATRVRGILSDWEKDFLDSIIEQIEKKGRLSPKQVQVFERVEKSTSPEAQAKAANWRDSFDEEKSKKTKAAASYYANGGVYYRNLCERILSEPDFVPSEKQYRKMVENKYMAKVFAAMTNVPMYPVGSVVQLRATCTDYYVRQALANEKPAVVISTDEPVISAAKGAKRYKLLPIGSASIVVAEERWIKKAKKMTSR